MAQMKQLSLGGGAQMRDTQVPGDSVQGPGRPAGGATGLPGLVTLTNTAPPLRQEAEWRRLPVVTVKFAEVRARVSCWDGGTTVEEVFLLS
ncbi:hypothetical protein NQZ68_000334 [Dissostichus eleginoides]|nr:hypothetical protein NQZ68_000334 [Dissostichus eleginoides]